MKRPRLWLELLNEYCKSLAVALFLAVVFAIAFGGRLPMSRSSLIGVSSLTFGTGYFLGGFVFRRLRLRTFALQILAMTISIIAVLLVCFTTMMLIWVRALNPNPDFAAEWQGVMQFVFSKDKIPTLFAGICITVVINSVFEINRKMGPGILWNWITGKYYTPREEQLVFMFLDLKDSTSLAEQLGPLKFSALIRDFFHDMTAPLLARKGKVSHYIGDEAVIYWRPKDALGNANCVQFFFDLKSAIADRTDAYRNAYGAVPEFKAGLHLGPVVATEVGDVKSEIVFHGDVLNTTARIQAECNALEASLLMSKQLADRIALPPALSPKPIGPVQLKGKAHEVELVSIIQSGRGGKQSTDNH